MKVSLYLEITEHKLALERLKLSMEPGLAKQQQGESGFNALPQNYHKKQGHIKGVGLQWTASLPVSSFSFPDEASVSLSLWEQSSYFIHNIYLLASCSLWTSTLLKPFPFFLRFPNEMTSLLVLSWQPFSLTRSHTRHIQTFCSSQKVTRDNKQQTKFRFEGMEGDETQRCWLLLCQSQLFPPHSPHPH